MKCRHCDTKLVHEFIDLGSSPPSNAYITDQTIHAPETWYPLKVMVCHECWLVQTVDLVGAEELFSEDYAYFSSFSASWLEHAEHYVEAIVSRLRLTQESTVVEIAANDGYLLQYVKERAIPCYGIDPTHSTALAAREKGIEIIEEFFGVKNAEELAAQGRMADLMVANNVLAHVPNINDFVKGFTTLLKPDGVATFEFPHLLNLVEQFQFDTIYHEHYSYLSLRSVQTIFEANGLMVFDVEDLRSHGGSLRIYAQRLDRGRHPVSGAVAALQKREEMAGIATLRFYAGLQHKAEEIKTSFIAFLIEAKQQGKSVAAYGAAAKGNTMINFAGIRTDMLPYVVDKNPAKQGKFLPGSRIPISNEDRLKTERPDYVIILPWNLKSEIISQLDYVRQWNGQFVVLVPELAIL